MLWDVEDRSTWVYNGHDDGILIIIIIIKGPPDQVIDVQNANLVEMSVEIDNQK